ncbi:mandelate racemase/muconate lactonizing enzyme family protein [Halobellus ordinarius]|uniref:mandelate racemase/muconate lactonizing enzyme family protein n=1 Tax=Halobellus ordinarius TaxID=3075120 RepID=UPI00288051D5|nr:mandelate racemase/muconate lactonizing enzyme family protein [Halobellus sp. ZY16]
MEITDIEAVLLSYVYPEDEQLEWSAGTIESWDASLVRVETDTGLVGWGEAGHALTGSEAVPGIVDAFRSQVVGRNPENVLGLREELYNQNLFWARGALPLGVIGAIEIAIYDVLSQDAGLPLYKLLGGRSEERVRVYGSAGIAATLEERVEQARSIAEDGFDIVKVRALGDPMANVDYVEALLDAVGPDVQVAFDAVQGSAGSPWPVKDSIRLGRALEEHADQIYWYEEPCRAENLDGFARVRDAVDIPVTGIESRTGRHEFRDVVDTGAVDVLQPDVTIAGGFAETAKISGYAAAHDIPLAMHVWGTGVSLLANCHFAAADTNTDVVEYCQLPNPLREEMLPDSFNCDGQYVTLPEEPGLGLDMPADLNERFEYVPGKGHVFD